MNQLTINDLTVDVVRKDIKNMHLAVWPPFGRVSVAAPLRVNLDAIRQFVISKSGWIKRNQKRFEDQERISPREYKERESHYFQGRRYLLRIKETEKSGWVELNSKTYLDMYVRNNASLEYKQRVLNGWYRKELQKILPEMIAYWENKIGVKVCWGVRQMKTKWSSYDIEKKRILFNLELAKKPIHCLEYILVHEMVPLLKRYNKDKFKNYMNICLPKWKQFKDELNRMPLSHSEWKNFDGGEK